MIVLLQCMFAVFIIALTVLELACIVLAMAAVFGLLDSEDRS